MFISSDLSLQVMVPPFYFCNSVRQTFYLLTFIKSEKSIFLSSFANKRSQNNEWNVLQIVLTKPYQRKYSKIESKFPSSCSVLTVQEKKKKA